MTLGEFRQRAVVGDFQAADNPLDEEFVRDLERVMARTRGELVAIATRNHKASL